MSENKTDSKWEEEMSKIIHDVWSHWQNYLHNISEIKDEKVSFPRELFERWDRQLRTSYNLLSEEEKQSDRDIFKKFYQDFISRIEKEAREDERKKFRESLNSFTYEPQNKNDKGNNVLKTLQAIFNEKTYG